MSEINDYKYNKILIKKPTQIDFYEESDTKIRITLCEKAAGCAKEGNFNMQDDGAAFEGWALILCAKGYENVEIDVDCELNTENTLKMGHYNRFLYRAMRFAEYYKKWFALSEKVLKAVEWFRGEYYSGKYILTNNIGSGPAGDNGNLENQIESIFAKNEETARVLTGISPLYRQLPVGLFKEKIKEKNRIFTGGKSAIDLWGVREDNLHIFELKALNAKVGVLSEILFYACYAYDMYCVGSPEWIIPNRPEMRGNDRGYSTLANKKTEKITAHILTDELHASIDADVIKLLKSCENERIVFSSPIMYKLDEVLSLLEEQ